MILRIAFSIRPRVHRLEFLCHDARLGGMDERHERAVALEPGYRYGELLLAR